MNWIYNPVHRLDYVYSSAGNSNGHFCIGASERRIAITKDYGNSWEVRKIRFKHGDRVYGVAMGENGEIICSSDYGEIVLLRHRFCFNKKLPSPAQAKYGYDFSIDKINFWGTYLVARQGQKVYYCNKDEMKWHLFKTRLTDFAIDDKTNDLYGITTDHRIVLAEDPENIITLSDREINVEIADIKAVDGLLYAVCNNGKDLYKVSRDTFIHVIPYTTDKLTKQPPIVHDGNNIRWGINERHLYLAEYGSGKWYREAIFPCPVKDFGLINDSTAILWDGNRTSYQYLLKEHDYQTYKPLHPIKDFLESEIESVYIQSSVIGCSGATYNDILYKKQDDGFLYCSQVKEYDRHGMYDTVFINIIHPDSLKNILIQIDQSPLDTPTISDFKIGETDILDYYKELKYRDSVFADGQFNKSSIYLRQRAFLDSLPPLLPSLNKGDIINLMDRNSSTGATIKNDFRVEIINSKNDTLHFSSHFEIIGPDWLLPWKTEYKGVIFSSYNIAFPQLIRKCIPENFINSENLSNSHFMISAGEYLFEKRNKAE